MKRNEAARKITKQDFAKLCGTSRPTLDKWIKQDRDGIRKYVTPDGIDEGIFKTEPWASMRKQPEAKQPKIDERDELRKQLDELRTENAILTERIKGLEALNTAQAAEIQRVTQLADQAQRLQLAQLTALPAPKKKLRDRLHDLFGKKEQDTEPEQQPPV